MKCIFLDDDDNCHAEEHARTDRWKVDEHTKKTFCTGGVSPYFEDCPRFKAKMQILTKKMS